MKLRRITPQTASMLSWLQAYPSEENLERAKAVIPKRDHDLARGVLRESRKSAHRCNASRVSSA